MKLTLIAALAAALSPLASHAGEISHTYVEAGVSHSVFDAPRPFPDVDFSGGYVRGSYEFGRGFYGFGSYSREAQDRRLRDGDLERTRLGIGHAYGLNGTTDLLSELGYVRNELGADVEGARASLGLRTRFNDRIEGWAKGSYTDGGDFGGDFSAQAGALYRFTPRWGVTGELEANEDARQVTLGVRASF